MPDVCFSGWFRVIDFIRYFLIYQYSVVRLMFWEIYQDISLLDAITTDFFHIPLKIERTTILYQKFPDFELATTFFSFACSRHTNKCKHLVFLKLKNILYQKNYLTKFGKNSQSCLLQSMDADTSGFQVMLHFYGNFQKLVLYC